MSVLSVDAARVRVAVRLRPRSAEDLSNADYPDCVEVQPEVLFLS